MAIPTRQMVQQGATPVVQSPQASSSLRYSPYDRSLRADDSLSSQKVAFSSFAFLFSEMCTRANLVPTKVKSVVETEERLATIGFQVGCRSVQLASLKDPSSFRQRPLTIEGVLKLITDRLWVRWFGRPASMQKDQTNDRYYITDDEPLVVKHVHPTPDYVDSSTGSWFMTYASFVGGMIRGVLDTSQFYAQVSTYHQPEAEKPKATWFVVEFDAQVWERMRRVNKVQ